MTRVLLYEPAFQRVAARIATLPPIDAVLMDREGNCRLAGREIAADDSHPEIGWATSDLFAGPVRPYMLALLKSPDLKWLQSGAAGFDHPVFAQIVAKGARLTTNHSQAIGMAEYVLSTVLDHFQRGSERRTAQREHEWKRLEYREAMGSRWLIVGFGAIGQEVAKRARAFGAHITGVRRSARSNALADAMITPDALRAALPDADVVVLSLPLDAATRGLVGPDFLAAMGKHAVLVNVGRGGLVNEGALAESLARGRPAHAILDVFETEPLPKESPLWDNPRITVTAHASAIGSGLTARTDALFVENLGRYLKGETLLNEVDAAEVSRGA